MYRASRSIRTGFPSLRAFSGSVYKISIFGSPSTWAAALPCVDMMAKQNRKPSKPGSNDAHDAHTKHSAWLSGAPSRGVRLKRAVRRQSLTHTRRKVRVEADQKYTDAAPSL